MGTVPMAPRAAKLKILVPINFSRKSEMALDFALLYSQHFKADVYLFHVFEDKTDDFRRLDRLNEEYMERMKQVAMVAIQRLAAQGATHTVEEVHRRIAQGKPPLEILKMAGGISADMVVMGASSSSDFRKFFAKVPCSVVLVKEKDPTFVL
ncbi:MAG: universal stress protein [Deltaproteobacteria bacterium]|nr:universal stress protein [Deltaproteobacteria bacterium]